MLDAEVIHSNYTRFLDRIDKCFPTRAEAIKNMYSSFGEDRVMFAPASSTDYFHNAIPGGYIDHILRVMNFSITTLQLWENMGLDTSNFTKEELLFVAMHHDLGKLGHPGDGKECYTPNKSDWHIKNQGKVYEVNSQIPNMAIQDRSLYLLQSFNITCSHNEWLGIKIHDGMYDDANHPYLSSFSLKNKIRTNLIFIIHDADMMAARFEFERWNKANRQLNLNPIEAELAATQVVTQNKKQEKVKDVMGNLAADFNTLFKS